MARSHKEPEDFEKDFSVNGQEFAIVDASVLQGSEHPLAKKAIIVPVKYADAIFKVSAQYDDTILRKLIIRPSQDESDPKAVKRKSQTPSPKEVGKGLDPGEKDTDNKHLVGEASRTVTHGSHGGRFDDITRPPGDQKFLDRNRRPRSPAGSDDNPGGIGRHAPKSPMPRRRSTMRKPVAKKPVAKKSVAKTRKSEVVEFVVTNMGKNITTDKLRAFEHKEVLSESLNMLMAMAMGGWEYKDGFITNGKYLLAEDSWGLNDGFLINAEDLAFDFDWIYDTKRSVDRLIQEDIKKNGDLLVESLNGGR